MQTMGPGNVHSRGSSLVVSLDGPRGGAVAIPGVRQRGLRRGTLTVGYISAKSHAHRAATRQHQGPHAIVSTSTLQRPMLIEKKALTQEEPRAWIMPSTCSTYGALLCC